MMTIWRRRWVQQTVLLVLLIAQWVVLFAFDGIWRWWGWLLYLAVLAFGWHHGMQVQRENKQLATVLWALAAELGYGAADLKRLSGRFGTLDWKATRPERMTFFPGTRLLTTLIRQLQAEQRRRMDETPQ